MKIVLKYKWLLISAAVVLIAWLAYREINTAFTNKQKEGCNA